MLNVVIENVGELRVLHLRGRIVSGVPIETLRKVVFAQESASAVILDLAWVDLIDAGGLGALLEIRMRAQSRGIEFKLMNVTRRVKDVLEITRLDSVFEFASREEIQAIEGRDQESEMMVAN
ncbi:MAG TPA: STAS domain-containing protein [Blastocatellia bacterium]|nr:STAS domain-containing protein [Blastocatellia bacterium]